MHCDWHVYMDLFCDMIQYGWLAAILFFRILHP